MLQGKTKLLHNRSIEEGEDINDKAGNFYMNDGPNIKITNALGVVLLELGNKWEYALRPDSPYCEPALTLLAELISLDPNMVFFKLRFLSIIDCMTNILLQTEMNSVDLSNLTAEKIRYKSYSIL